MTFRLCDQISRRKIPLIVVTDRYSHWAKDYTHLALEVSTRVDLYWDSMSAISSILNLLTHAVAEKLGKAAEQRMDELEDIAGILRFNNLADTTLDEWNQVIAVNLTGTFLMCQTAMPHLLEVGGNIVNTASTAALGGHPWTAAYSASKGGILAFSQGLAIEFGRQGVRTNIVAPGSISTPITDQFFFPEGADKSLLSRIMAFDTPRGPEYVASVIAFVASDDGGHMNGSVLRCDGGTLS